jgi:hypothetical protein
MRSRFSGPAQYILIGLLCRRSLRDLCRCFDGWLGRGRLRGFRFFLGGEFLLDLGRDCGHVHLVKLGGIAQNVRGVAARGGEQDNGLDHGAAQRAFIGAAKKGREDFAYRFVLFGLLDAVLLGKNRGAVLVC